LFVCTANQFRSPLAAASLLDVIQSVQPSGDWLVESAGTWAKAGLPAPELAQQIAVRLGLPTLESHRTRQVDQELLASYDLCLVMEAGQKEALCSEFAPLKKRFHMLSEITTGIAYDIPDPAMPGVDPDEVGREIKTLIAKGANKIFHLAESLSTAS